MRNPSQPGRRHDRRSAPLSASVERARRRVRDGDVSARQANREERPQDPVDRAHLTRSRDAPRAPIDQRRIIIAQTAGDQHHRADSRHADR